MSKSDEDEYDEESSEEYDEEEEDCSFGYWWWVLLWLLLRLKLNWWLMLTELSPQYRINGWWRRCAGLLWWDSWTVWGGLEEDSYSLNSDIIDGLGRLGLMSLGRPMILGGLNILRRLILRGQIE